LQRERSLSAGEIAEIVEDEGTDISVRTVERILAEAGFPKLPRRTRLLIGETRARTTVPEVSHRLAPAEMTGPAAGYVGSCPPIGGSIPRSPTDVTQVATVAT
jgi:hypothetical protein